MFMCSGPCGQQCPENQLVNSELTSKKLCGNCARTEFYLPKPDLQILSTLDQKNSYALDKHNELLRKENLKCQALYMHNLGLYGDLDNKTPRYNLYENAEFNTYVYKLEDIENNVQDIIKTINNKKQD